MYINTFKYSPQDVSCQLCTEYVKKVGCTALRCPWLAERIEAGVVGYYDEITVLPAFSDACHFDHSFVCIDTKDTNLCDTKLSPNPTKNGHDTCANRAKHQKFANITNSEDSPKRENPHCGCAGQAKTPGSLPGECQSCKAS